MNILENVSGKNKNITLEKKGSTEVVIKQYENTALFERVLNTCETIIKNNPSTPIPHILKSENNSIHMELINGVTLLQKLFDLNETQSANIADKLVDCLISLKIAGYMQTDNNLSNYILCNDIIYAIDIDDILPKKKNSLEYVISDILIHISTVKELDLSIKKAFNRQLLSRISISTNQLASAIKRTVIRREIKIMDVIIPLLMASDTKVALIGFMGSGKSHFAKDLAKNTGRSFASTDKLIEEKLQDTIPNIFSEYSEQYFREQETKVIIKTLQTNTGIIDLGGGAIFANKYIIQQNCLILHLDTPYQIILTRLLNCTDRPLIKNSNNDKIQSLYNSRIELYRRFAHFNIV